MEGIVADLVAGTHIKKSLACGLERSTIDVAMVGARDIAWVSFRSFVR
jgi:hypothetical protein